MNYKILTILAFLFLAVACGPSEGPLTVGDTFVGGTTGLEMSFLPNAPPAEVFDGGQYPFSTVIQIKNDGEWPIDSGDEAKVTLSGVSPTDFSLSSPTLSLPQALSATKKDPAGNVIEGGTATVEFNNMNYQKELLGDQAFTLKTDVCYQYGTNAQAVACVLKDMTSTEPSVCSVSGTKPIANSGAPIQVSSVIESQAGTDKLSLTFTVSHVGSGRVYRRASDCLDDFEQKDVVEMTVDTGLSGLTCAGLTSAGSSASGEVRLFGGERQITCIQETGGQGDFEQPLTVKLEYDYEQSMQKQITVKHI